MQVRRTGPWFVLRFLRLSGASATSSYFASLPRGFVAGNQNITVRVGTRGEVVWVPSSAGSLSLPQSTPSSGILIVGTQFVGDLERPSTLPGVPA